MPKKRKNAKSGINVLSGFLYDVNKMLRNVNALHKGTLFDRIVRLYSGKMASKALGSDFMKNLFR